VAKGEEDAGQLSMDESVFTLPDPTSGTVSPMYMAMQHSSN